jgi:hypothetical protein
LKGEKTSSVITRTLPAAFKFVVTNIQVFPCWASTDRKLRRETTPLSSDEGYSEEARALESCALSASGPHACGSDPIPMRTVTYYHLAPGTLPAGIFENPSFFKETKSIAAWGTRIQCGEMVARPALHAFYGVPPGLIMRLPFRILFFTVVTFLVASVVVKTIVFNP